MGEAPSSFVLLLKHRPHRGPRLLVGQGPSSLALGCGHAVLLSCEMQAFSLFQLKSLLLRGGWKQ